MRVLRDRRNRISSGNASKRFEERSRDPRTGKNSGSGEGGAEEERRGKEEDEEEGCEERRNEERRLSVMCRELRCGRVLRTAGTEEKELKERLRVTSAVSTVKDSGRKDILLYERLMSTR